jgi:subtilisin family serine protease
MELGKNPGLDIRQLHEQGITGRGVGIAIIDQTLLVDHQEYVNQLRLYEEGSDIQGGWLQTQMHGPAVASIAVGKTTGVAPEADLFYIATSMCNTTGTFEGNDLCLPGPKRPPNFGDKRTVTSGSQDSRHIHVCWLGPKCHRI